MSPDKPENLKPTVAKNELNYQLLSDSEMAAARGFGIAFQVGDRIAEQLKGYGIDLVESSGEDHKMLPVPAVFLLDEEGTIQFQYVNPNYRVRIPATLVLEAAKLH